MITPTAKKTLGVIVVSLSLLYIGFYYQTKNPNYIFPHKYDQNNTRELQFQNTLLKQVKVLMENYLGSNSSVSHGTELSTNVPTPVEKLPPWPSVSGCYPFFEDLYVKPVAEHDCDQPHIFINHAGRLGNKICEYISLYLLRHLFGVRVSITTQMHAELNKVFKNIVLPIYDKNCFTNKTKSIRYLKMYDKLYRASSQARMNATNKNFITKPLLETSHYVNDYPWPQNLLLKHRELIRSLLIFRDEVTQAAITNINGALKQFNTTFDKRSFPIVTVHVRRTDYAHHLKVLHNMTQLDEFYYNTAFQFYRERLKRPLFLVASDDPKWCRQKLQTKDVLVIASKVREVDLAAMTLGDHHVLSYGTFGFSGALLGHGNITHPRISWKKYGLVKCMDRPFFHTVPWSKTEKMN